MSTVLYRYADVATGDGVRVYLRTYSITKETAKGVWIDEYGQKRFVLSGTRKCFAHPTVEEARTSFIARKTKQIKILTSQLQRANDALSAAPSSPTTEPGK